MRILYFLYTWLVFIPLVVLDTVFFGAICLLMAPFFSPRRVGFATAVPWARVGLATSWVTVHIHGREHVDPTQSYVVVANHLSLFDIWVLYGWLNMDLRWVAKKEVRYIPIIGICCVALGHVFVDRSNHSKAMASLQQARDRITNGTSILFFPEGTRSRTGELEAVQERGVPHGPGPGPPGTAGHHRRHPRDPAVRHRTPDPGARGHAGDSPADPQ